MALEAALAVDHHRPPDRQEDRGRGVRDAELARRAATAANEERAPERSEGRGELELDGRCREERDGITAEREDHRSQLQDPESEREDEHHEEREREASLEERAVVLVRDRRGQPEVPGACAGRLRHALYAEAREWIARLGCGWLPRIRGGGRARAAPRRRRGRRRRSRARMRGRPSHKPSCRRRSR